MYKGTRMENVPTLSSNLELRVEPQILSLLIAMLRGLVNLVMNLKITWLLLFFLTVSALIIFLFHHFYLKYFDIWHLQFTMTLIPCLLSSEIYSEVWYSDFVDIGNKYGGATNIVELNRMLLTLCTEK